MSSMRTSLRQPHRNESWSGDQTRFCEQSVVSSRMLAAHFIPLSNSRQLHSQHGGLDCVEAAIPSEFIVIVPLRAAMIPQAPHVLGHLWRSGRHDARISVGAQVLGGIKTECCSDSERPSRTASPLCPDCLRRILYESHIVLLRHLIEGVHVGALSI